MFHMPSCFICHLNIVWNGPKTFFYRINSICFFFSFLQYATNMPLTQKWRSLVYFYQKVLIKQYPYESTLRMQSEVRYFSIVVYDLLHFKSNWAVSQLKFCEETTPQWLHVLESSTFDRQKFLYICASRKLYWKSKNASNQKNKSLRKNLDTILV